MAIEEFGGIALAVAILAVLFMVAGKFFLSGGTHPFLK